MQLSLSIAYCTVGQVGASGGKNTDKLTKHLLCDLILEQCNVFNSSVSRNVSTQDSPELTGDSNCHREKKKPFFCVSFLGLLQNPG